MLSIYLEASGRLAGAAAGRGELARARALLEKALRAVDGAAGARLRVVRGEDVP